MTVVGRIGSSESAERQARVELAACYRLVDAYGMTDLIYNHITARIYEDIGFFTSEPEIGRDATELFNYLTGYAQAPDYQSLLVAPYRLKTRMIELIDKEASFGERGRITMKMNSLVDADVIDALYRASQAGVRVDLIVRGVCCLRPGVPGQSENITVRSVVDRFLEHSRIFVFGPDEEAQVFLASADWMPRNFHRRVEVMFPLLDPAIRQRVLREIALFADRCDITEELTRLRSHFEQFAALLKSEGEIGRKSEFLLQEIGRGGMGVVFRARDQNSGHLVALKVLPWRASVVPEWVARFESEARTAGEIRHPGIVPVYKYGQEDGYSYIAMQLIPGIGLDRVIQLLGAQGQVDLRQLAESAGVVTPESEAAEQTDDVTHNLLGSADW